MAQFSVILPAAGQSSRFKDKEKKPFATLDGRAVWLRTIELFVTRADVLQCIMVIAKADQETFCRRNAAHMAFMNVQIADGGSERFESVANALIPASTVTRPGMLALTTVVSTVRLAMKSS